MGGAEGLDQCRSRGRDLGEDMLVVKKQVLVFGLERFQESGHGIRAEVNQILGDALPLYWISQLLDEPFCFRLFRADEPVHGSILLGSAQQRQKVDGKSLI